MAHKNKHKRLLRDIRKRAKGHQLRQTRRKDEGGDPQRERRFMFADYIVNCDEAIAEYMEPADGYYCRVVDDPEREKDICPASLWRFEGLAPDDTDIPEILPPDASIEEQWRQLQEYSPSFNLTERGAAGMLLPFYRKKKTQAQKEKFLKAKGGYVKTYRLCPDDGLIQKRADADNGHLIFMPYEDFELSKHAVDTVPPKPLISFLDDDEGL